MRGPSSLACLLAARCEHQVGSWARPAGLHKAIGTFGDRAGAGVVEKGEDQESQRGRLSFQQRKSATKHCPKIPLPPRVASATGLCHAEQPARARLESRVRGGRRTSFHGQRGLGATLPGRGSSRAVSLPSS